LISINALQWTPGTFLAAGLPDLATFAVIFIGTPRGWIGARQLLV
jgi:hypothetical protein